MADQNIIFKSIGPQAFILPCPVFLVGTYSHAITQSQSLVTATDVFKNTVNKDDARKPNIMAASWTSLCSAQPPTMLVAIRQARHTHKSILEHKAFTINIPDTGMVAEVDYAGIFSGEHEDKIQQCGLHTEAGEHVDAPYIKECPVVLEMKLIEYHEAGTHTIFIGEIMDVKIKESCLDESGMPSPASMDILCYIPMLREYWGLGEFKAKAFGIGKTIASKK